jgi:hypothetical protein
VRPVPSMSVGPRPQRVRAQNGETPNKQPIRLGKIAQRRLVTSIPASPFESSSRANPITPIFPTPSPAA